MSSREEARRLYGELLVVVSSAWREAWRTLRWWELAVLETQRACAALAASILELGPVEELGAREERGAVLIKTPWGDVAAVKHPHLGAFLLIRARDALSRLGVPPACLLGCALDSWVSLSRLAEDCYVLHQVLEVLKNALERLSVPVEELEGGVVEELEAEEQQLDSPPRPEDLDYFEGWVPEDPGEWVEGASVALEQAGTLAARLVSACHTCGEGHAHAALRELVDYAVKEAVKVGEAARYPVYTFLIKLREARAFLDAVEEGLEALGEVPCPSTVEWPEALDALRAALRVAKKVEELARKLAPRTEGVASELARRARTVRRAAEALEVLVGA